MSDNLPSPPQNSWVPQWVQSLKHIPTALSSVGKLITGSADAAVSWIDTGTALNEQESQSIRDVTEARSLITKTAARIASQEMESNPGLAIRTINRIFEQDFQKQKSREYIGIKALEYIYTDPPSDQPTNEPTLDWLNIFGSYAERATSETMRDHWAHILSGEIRKPGSFSYAALHLASLLDKQTAEAIERVATMVVDQKTIPFVGNYNQSGSRYDDLLALDGIGFLLLNSSTEDYTFSADGILIMNIAGTDVPFKGPANEKMYLSCAFMTRAGKEILSIIQTSPNDEYISHLIDTVSNYDFSGDNYLHQINNAHSLQTDPFGDIAPE